MNNWIKVCNLFDIDPEDLIVKTIKDTKIAIYRGPNDEVYATAGTCTHEQVSLEDGLVTDYIIECPLHNGRFDYRTGEPKSPPVCVALATYEVKQVADEIYIYFN